MARTHFSGPIRTTGGLQVVSSISTPDMGGKNDSASNVITSIGDFVDTASNLMLDYSAREVFCSGLTLGVSGTDTKMTALRIYSATLGSGSIAGASIVQSSYTLAGLTTADKILCIQPPNSGISSGGAASLLGISYAMVSAADTLTIGWLNANANANVHTTGIYTVVALRS